MQRMNQVSPSAGARGEMSATASFLLAAGFLLHFAMGVVVLVGGLIMPPAAVVALGAVWAGALVVAILWRRRPWLVLAVPFAMLAIWLITAWIGDAFFAWTA